MLTSDIDISLTEGIPFEAVHQAAFLPTEGSACESKDKSCTDKSREPLCSNLNQDESAHSVAFKSIKVSNNEELSSKHNYNDHARELAANKCVSVIQSKPMTSNQVPKSHTPAKREDRDQKENHQQSINARLMYLKGK